ncbi:MAG: ATP-binding protein, partial [Actinomycetaceae bacterium]|nr:ATP-binding protein [Actinomycetaceae bacterium]
MSTNHTESQRWATCLQIIRNNVSQQQYDIWFAPVTFDSFDVERNELTLCVPSPYFREHIETHFLTLLRQVLLRIYGRGIKLIYKVKVDAEHGLTVNESSTDCSTAVCQTMSSQPANAAPEPLQQLDSNLNADYTFDNFVEGVANKLPRTVGLSIAQNPHQMTFNPLFVYGASGVGKTHLVNAIGTRLKELHPARRVLYVSAHLFQVQYTDAVRQNRVNDFIAFYQSIDVLIIDDIQEFATLEKTQLAFFHIFNHLHQNGRQLILTSDRPPVALSGMNERLLTRFKWGLLAELEKPDKE